MDLGWAEKLLPDGDDRVAGFLKDFISKDKYDASENPHQIKDAGGIVKFFGLDRLGIKDMGMAWNAFTNKDSEAAKILDEAMEYAVINDNKGMLKFFDTASSWSFKGITAWISSKIGSMLDFLPFVNSTTAAAAGLAASDSVADILFGKDSGANWLTNMAAGEKTAAALKEKAESKAAENVQADKTATAAAKKESAAGAQPAAKPASTVTVTPLAKGEPIVVLNETNGDLDLSPLKSNWDKVKKKQLG